MRTTKREIINKYQIKKNEQNLSEGIYFGAGLIA